MHAAHGAGVCHCILCCVLHVNHLFVPTASFFFQLQLHKLIYLQKKLLHSNVDRTINLCLAYLVLNLHISKSLIPTYTLHFVNYI